MAISPITSTTYNSPTFKAVPKWKPNYLAKTNAFVSDVSKKWNQGYDNFVENVLVKPVIVPAMNSKVMSKLADGTAKIDNMAAHMSTAGSFVTTAVYANRTLNTLDDKERARTLALNQVMVTGLSTLGAYTVNKKLDKLSKGLGYKFREANQGSKHLTKRMQGFNIAKQLLIFSAMYRYVAPVLVTPLASKLGKVLENRREAKEQAKAQAIATK